MYQNIYYNRKTKTTYLWDDENGLTEFQFEPYAYRKRKGGIYRSIYGDELEKITRFNPKDPSLFESDVSIDTRILLDVYEDSDEPSTGHTIAYIDIEVDSVGGFPDLKTANKEITAITIYDSVTCKYTAFILDKAKQISSNNTDPNITVESVLDEHTLINKFITKWEEISPTIVTGWNTDKFDLPYLHARISRVCGKDTAARMSPIKIAYLNDWNGKMVIAGVSCLDYMELFKKFAEKKEPSYALAAIGKKMVNMDKVQFTGSLDDLYKTDIAKYIEYNIHDVRIVVALEKKLQFIELARKICHIGHVPYEQFMWSSRYIEGAILTFLRRNGKRVSPNKPMDGKEEYEHMLEDNEEGFSGAYVKDPIPGRYEWIYDLDLTSMYPNIIISLNISPETKVGIINDWDSDKYINGEYENISVGGTMYPVADFKRLVTEQNLSIASNGALYSLRSPGVIPSILIDWFNERKKLRKLAKEHADAKNWEKYEFFDQRQKVQKILLNSAYGVLGLPLFRFYDKENAEAVTKSGVTIIKNAEKSVNNYYNKLLNTSQDYVIYIDTDSVFVGAVPLIKFKYPNINLDNEQDMTKAILDVCTEVQGHVNKGFDHMASNIFNVTKHRFDAKQEVIAKTGFWLVKKRYTQFIINKAGIEVSEIEIKGIDVVRTSFPIKFRSFMSQFIKDLLNKNTKEQIDSTIIDFKKNIENVDPIELAKNTSVKFVSQDNLNDYDPHRRVPFTFIDRTPVQVKAALAYNDLLKLWKLDSQYQKIQHGQKIKWVYLKENQYGIDSLAMKADGSDPTRILDFISENIDRDALYDKELRSKIESFYEVLKWSFPDETHVNAMNIFEF